jgi:hypothetical protein
MYLDFKVGEVWSEIATELAVEGVRPTTPDEEMILAAHEAGLSKSVSLKQEQEEILRATQQVI